MIRRSSAPGTILSLSHLHTRHTKICIKRYGAGAPFRSRRFRSSRLISKAADVLLSNPYIEVMDNGGALIVSESGVQIYQINGRCEGEVGKPCKSYQFNHGICYQRALKRLATRYAE